MIKINRQRNIMMEIAKKHGILMGQADEIWQLFNNKIEEVISDTDVMTEDNYFDANKFKLIHIDNFGKFIPLKKNINYVNLGLKNKRKKDESSS